MSAGPTLQGKAALVTPTSIISTNLVVETQETSTIPYRAQLPILINLRPCRFIFEIRDKWSQDNATRRQKHCRASRQAERLLPEPRMVSAHAFRATY